jgi:hypothetical protein
MEIATMMKLQITGEREFLETLAEDEPDHNLSIEAIRTAEYPSQLSLDLQVAAYTTAILANSIAIGTLIHKIILWKKKKKTGKVLFETLDFRADIDFDSTDFVSSILPLLKRLLEEATKDEKPPVRN